MDAKGTSSSGKGSNKSGKGKRKKAADGVAKKMPTGQALSDLWFKLSPAQRDGHYQTLQVRVVGPLLFQQGFSTGLRNVALEAGILDGDDVVFKSPRDLDLVGLFQFAVLAAINDVTNASLLEHIITIADQFETYTISNPPQSTWFTKIMTKLSDNYPGFRAKVRFNALLLVLRHLSDHVKALLLDSKDLTEEFAQCYKKNEASTSRIKMEGNSSFNEADYPKAITLYSNALRQHPFSAVLYSNRCICYLKLSKSMLALVDGKRCTVLQPNWERGQHRYVQALQELGCLDLAKEANEKARLICTKNADLLKQHEIIMAAISKCDPGVKVKMEANDKSKSQRKGKRQSQYDGMPELVSDEDYDEDFDDYTDEEDWPTQRSEADDNPYAAKHFTKPSKATSSTKPDKSAPGAHDMDDDDDLPDLVALDSDNDMMLDSDTELPSEELPLPKKTAKPESKPSKGAAVAGKSHGKTSAVANKESATKTGSKTATVKAQPAKKVDAAAKTSKEKKPTNSAAARKVPVAHDNDEEMFEDDLPDLVSSSGSDSDIGVAESIDPAAARPAAAAAAAGAAVSPTVTTAASTNTTASAQTGHQVSASASVGFSRFEVTDLLIRGSQEMLMGEFQLALPHYSDALKAATTNSGLMADRETMVLRYCLSAAYLGIGDASALSNAAAHLNSIITNYASTSFPLVHLGYAQLHIKQNSFPEAKEAAEKGISMLEKAKGQLLPCTWPGTDKVIPESQGKELQAQLIDLRAGCLNPPRPEALCRWAECKPRRQIYTSDPDYKGYVRVSCTMSCSIEYHHGCWKQMRYDNPAKPSEKDLLSGSCLTPDCPGSVDCITTHDTGPNPVRELRDETVVKPKASAASAKNRKAKTHKAPKPRPLEEDADMQSASAAGTTSEVPAAQEPVKRSEAKEKNKRAGDAVKPPTDPSHLPSHGVPTAPAAQDAAPAQNADVGSISEASMVLLKRDDDDGAVASAAKSSKIKAKKKKAKAAQTVPLDAFLGDQYVPRNADGEPLVSADCATQETLYNAPPRVHAAQEQPYQQVDVAASSSLLDYANVTSSSLPGVKTPSNYPGLQGLSESIDPFSFGEPLIPPSAATVDDTATDGDDLESICSVFAETIRFQGQMAVDDDTLLNLLALMPLRIQEKIDKAGGLAVFLRRSSQLAFRGNRVCLREFLQSVDDTGPERDVSEAVDIVRPATADSAVSAASSAEGYGNSPALRADASEFVPKMRTVTGQLPSDAGFVDDSAAGNSDSIMPLQSSLYVMPSSMPPAYPVMASPAFGPPPQPNFFMPSGLQAGPGMPFPVGNGPPGLSMMGPVATASPPMPHQNMFLPPGSAVSAAGAAATPVLSSASVDNAFPPAANFPDPSTLSTAKPVPLAEQMAEDVLSVCSTSSRSSVDTGSKKAADSAGPATVPVHPTTGGKSKKQKKKAAITSTTAAVVADDGGDDEDTVSATVDQACQTDPTLDTVAIAHQKTEECTILHQQLSDVHDRSHRQKRQSEMELGTANKTVAERDETISKQKTEIASLREKNEADAKNVADAKRIRHQMKELEAREAKLRTEFEHARRELVQLQQQVDVEREEFSKQLSLTESREEDLQSTVELLKRRTIAAEVQVLEGLRDARLREIETHKMNCHQVVMRFQQVIQAGHSTPQHLEQQQHFMQQLQELGKCAETLRTMATEQIRSVETGEKDLASLPPLGVQLPRMRPFPAAAPAAAPVPAHGVAVGSAPPPQSTVQAPPAANVPVANQGASGVRHPLLETPSVSGAGVSASAKATSPAQPSVTASSLSSSSAAAAGQSTKPTLRPTTTHQSQRPTQSVSVTRAASESVPMASQSSTRTATSSPGIAASASSNGKGPSAPVSSAKTGNDKKPNSFEKIINSLTTMYPTHRREDLVDCIRQVRHNNNDSLSGISLEEVVRRAKVIMEGKPPRSSAPPPGIRSADPISASVQRLANRNTSSAATANPGGRHTGAATACNEEQEDCIICCDEMNPRNSTTLGCGHRFHTECIRKWFNEQRTCPTCRNHSLMSDEYPALA